ncbi:MAG: hypothetical protein ABW047_04560 [Nitrospiraceae bacterium]
MPLTEAKAAEDFTYELRLVWLELNFRYVNFSTYVIPTEEAECVLLIDRNALAIRLQPLVQRHRPRGRWFDGDFLGR